MAETKFRPYLTSQELTLIINCLKQNGTNPGLVHYLSSFQDKISIGKIAPNLVTKPSIQEKLELGLSPKESTDKLKEQRADAYNKWLTSPHKCSIQELARARMYRYENDLMSTEEETEYESTLDRGY